MNINATKRLRNRETKPQENAPANLRFVSQPRDQMIEGTSDYVYEESAGEGITIYVVDTGANRQSLDIDEMSGKVEWLWPSEELWVSMTEEDFDEDYKKYTDPGDHGCCVVTLAVGKSYGVAKRANLVIAKVISGVTWEMQGKVLITSWMEAIATVIQDMENRVEKGNSISGKTVVNFSTGQIWDSTDEIDKLWIKRLNLAIARLLELDAVIVIAAGNSRVFNLIDFYRPVLAENGLNSIGCSRGFRCC